MLVFKGGDVSIGKALFYAEHPYNTAYDLITKHGFAGVSALTIIADGHEPGVFREVSNCGRDGAFH